MRRAGRWSLEAGASFFVWLQVLKLLLYVAVFVGGFVYGLLGYRL